MKKTSKIIIALVFVLTLASAPSIALAAPQPILVYEDPSMGYKYFEYQPSSLIIQPGHSDILRNNVNGGVWYVQAGQQLYFNCSFDYASTYEFKIVRTSTSPQEIIVSETVYTDGFGITTLPMEQSGTYLIIVEPKTSLGAMINSYAVQIQ
jgi:hypothetical protein